MTAFFNSLLYSLGGTVLAVLLSALAAYVLARHRTRRHQIIYLLLIMGIAIPTNFVTLMKVMQVTHLIDSQIGMILLYAATQIPFSVFLIYAFVDSAAAGARRGGLHRRLLADPDLLLGRPPDPDAGAGDLRGPQPPQHLERVPDAALLPEQHRAGGR